MKNNMNQGGNNSSRQSRVKSGEKSKGVIRVERSVYELPEGTRYVGEIKDCRVVDSKNGEALLLAIYFEKSRTTFKKFLPNPLSDDSPVGKELLTIDIGDESEFYCELLIGLTVEFSTQYNGEYCNFKTFEILWDQSESEDSYESDDEAEVLYYGD